MGSIPRRLDALLTYDSSKLLSTVAAWHCGQMVGSQEEATAYRTLQ